MKQVCAPGQGRRHTRLLVHRPVLALAHLVAVPGSIAPCTARGRCETATCTVVCRYVGRRSGYKRIHVDLTQHTGVQTVHIVQFAAAEDKGLQRRNVFASRCLCILQALHDCAHGHFGVILGMLHVRTRYLSNRQRFEGVGHANLLVNFPMLPLAFRPTILDGLALAASHRAIKTALCTHQMAHARSSQRCAVVLCLHSARVRPCIF